MIDFSRSPRIKFRKAVPSGWMFWGLLIVIATTISATLGAIAAFLIPRTDALLRPPTQNSGLTLWQQAVPYRITLTRPVNILILGIDQVPQHSTEIFSGHSDTVLVVQLNPQTDSISLLSIPRDTLVEIPDKGLAKISQVNFMGGSELTLKIAQTVLNDLPIDRYIRVSTGAFRELVDLLEGVEVYVKQPMSYVDNSQNLRIDLAAGWQTLNGEQAEGFARFRSDQYGDIGRVQRQQALIAALKKRLTSASLLPRLPQVLRVMQKYIDTNLSSEELLGLVGFGLQVDPDHFKMVMLPGSYSSPWEYASSYWMIDGAGRDRILRDYFKVNWSKATWYQDTLPRGIEPQSETLKIAIQNATGLPNSSTELADYLEKMGFKDLYFVKDWSETHERTEIIVQKGNLQGAKAVQKALGLGKIEPNSTGDIDSDLTIRIGKDWIK